MKSVSKESATLLENIRVLTFFVTYKCNARCKTCFYWQEINNPDKPELSLKEIEKISSNLPPFPHLLLSGGEPLLRSDLKEIVSIFVKNNFIVTVDLPTNGLLPEEAAEFVRFISAEYPDILLTLGVSIDGLKQTHDALRSVPGGFEKVFETLDAINDERYIITAENGGIEPRLHLYTLTVLTAETVADVPHLIAYVNERADVDGMMFELMRGSPRDKSLRLPSLQEFDNVVALSLKTNYELFSKRCSPSERSLRLAYLKEVYRLQRAVLKGEKLPLYCQAGRSLAVLEPNGDVRLCELLDPIGNLREADYDFSKLWNSELAQSQRQWIKSTRCSCTHCVNLGHSIDLNKRSFLRRKFNEWSFLCHR